jgi:hypothetical protein
MPGVAVCPFSLNGVRVGKHVPAPRTLTVDNRAGKSEDSRDRNSCVHDWIGEND